MPTSSLTATKLRIFLSIAIVLLVAAGVGVFVLGSTMLRQHALSISQTATEAEQSENKRRDLLLAKIDLAKYSSAVERASKIAAESASYMYQNQITTDVYQMAAKSGIEITGISFGAEAQTGAAQPAAPVVDPAATPGAAPAVSTTKPTSATIAIKSPVGYDNMLDFIYSIERNLTKMRIGSIGLSAPTDDKDKGKVTSDTVTIEVYLQ